MHGTAHLHQLLESRLWTRPGIDTTQSQADKPLAPDLCNNPDGPHRLVRSLHGGTRAVLPGFPDIELLCWSQGVRAQGGTAAPRATAGNVHASWAASLQVKLNESGLFPELAPMWLDLTWEET